MGRKSYAVFARIASHLSGRRSNIPKQPVVPGFQISTKPAKMRLKELLAIDLPELASSSTCLNEVQYLRHSLEYGEVTQDHNSLLKVVNRLDNLCKMYRETKEELDKKSEMRRSLKEKLATSLGEYNQVIMGRIIEKQVKETKMKLKTLEQRIAEAGLEKHDAEYAEAIERQELKLAELREKAEQLLLQYDPEDDDLVQVKRMQMLGRTSNALHKSSEFINDFKKLAEAVHNYKLCCIDMDTAGTYNDTDTGN